MAAYPCSDDPNEVLEAVVSAQANAEKFDKFVNGGVLEEVQLGTGQPTPTLRNLSHLVKSAAAELDGSDVSGKFSDAANGGETLRMLADRFGDMVNVKDFGAIGDGIADDTVAFNAAAQAAGERLIYVPAGSYALSSGPAGRYFSDGPVDTGGIQLSLFDPGTLHASALLDTLDFGFLCAVRRYPGWPSDTDAYPAQGLACDTENGILYIAQHHSSTTQYITKYSIADKKILSKTYFSSLGHTNSMEFKDGKLYVVTMDSNNSYRIAVIKPSTMGVDSWIVPTEQVTSICWDKTRNCWWSGGTTICRWSDAFQTVAETFSLPYSSGETTGQGITCDEDGLLYIPRYRDDGVRRSIGHVIQVFDPAVGRTIQRYDLPHYIGEPEEVVFYQNYMICFFGSNSTYYLPVYACKYKKGVHPSASFAPLVGESSMRPPLAKTQTGTNQQSVFYVDASLEAQGDGTADMPFNSLAVAQEVALMHAAPNIVFYVTGDCTESGYIKSLWFQHFKHLSIRGYDDEIGGNILPGFMVTECATFDASNFTVKGLNRVDAHDSFVYFRYVNVNISSMAWDTSDFNDTIQGLLYCSYDASTSIGSMDFSGVGAGVCEEYLCRFTNGSNLMLYGSPSSFIVPNALSGIRVFDCKQLCVSQYNNMDSLIYMDGDIYAQRVIVSGTVSAGTVSAASYETNG